MLGAELKENNRMFYQVWVKEVHILYVEIEADSTDKAIEAVADGEGEDYGDSEYIYTLDSGEWEIKEVK